MCAEIRKKFLVRQVSETRRGVYHLIIFSQDASYRGVDLLPPSCQGQLLKDSSDGGGCDDTAFVGPCLCRRVIDVFIDVLQGGHPWCEEQDMHEQRP